jgi:hypothetical protein
MLCPHNGHRIDEKEEEKKRDDDFLFPAVHGIRCLYIGLLSDHGHLLIFIMSH